MFKQSIDIDEVEKELNKLISNYIDSFMDLCFDTLYKIDKIDLSSVITKNIGSNIIEVSSSLLCGTVVLMQTWLLPTNSIRLMSVALSKPVFQLCYNYMNYHTDNQVNIHQENSKELYQARDKLIKQLQSATLSHNHICTRESLFSDAVSNMVCFIGEDDRIAQKNIAKDQEQIINVEQQLISQC